MSEKRIPNYWKVQLSVGMLEPGTSRGSVNLSEEVGSISVDMHNYTSEMDCVDVTSRAVSGKDGRLTNEVLRTALPGEICNDCDAAFHCVLLLMFQNQANEQVVPPKLLAKQYRP